MSLQYHNNADLASAVTKAIPKLAVAPVTLTTSVTALTHTAPTTPDYIIAALTTTTPFGFVSADEGNTVLKVIANLQTRLNELEVQLKAAGILV